VSFHLLTQFQLLFDGKPYLHRVSTHGDYVAQFVFEDLYALQHSQKLVQCIVAQRSVLNAKNKAHGVKHRRGDGSFGTIIPGDIAISDSGFSVGRGPIANVEMGIEVKILAKAMIKQIDRVKNDLLNQARQFRRSEGRAIVAAVVGIKTDGRKYPHPCDEAAAATRHIEELRDSFDELLILPFRATNVAPYPFEWVDANRTRQDYGSFLVRISRHYDNRF
jgi:hypothetical protein